ncbi:hypothetical protein C6P40_004652 [Pichia californica]|uniref:RING-type domain-containing protein n=1 Tax=Pichia californica TaxID=460514 RepID=A0A9P6WP28_9ASCO|nr:hypothetical protein C6P40_004652 [[Candida] californica]
MYKKDLKSNSDFATSLNNITSSGNDGSNFSNNINFNDNSSNMKKSSSRNRSSNAHSKRNNNNNNNNNSNTKKGNNNNSSRSNNNSKLNINSNYNNHQLVDDSQDILSMIKGSKKGMNISHLLTYNYSNDVINDEIPISKSQQQQKSKSSNKKKNSTYDVHLSGLSYINANYKFILNNNGDYKLQLLDPNLPLNIHDIARVVVKQNDYHCPICMGDDFVAPRMTKCGHIFCYSCLISMFDNVKNDKSKTSLGNLHNPIISCPLCSEVIKEKFILLPVLIEPVNESSKIQLKSNILLSLMYRANSKIYSQPVSNFYQFFKGFNGNIPWISENSTPLNYNQYSPYISNSRLIMCDYNFIKSCYQKEIDDLMTQKLLDYELYGDSGSFYDIAVNNIKKEILTLNKNIEESIEPIKYGPKQIDQKDLSNNLDNLTISNDFSIRLPSFKDGFYYYQYNINSRIHYFLSPLDVSVINSLFKIPNIKDFEIDQSIENPAFNLPLNLNVYIENINSDENKVTPELVTKYPFLGNLPYGAEIGFMEIDWTKFDNSFIPINENDINDISTKKNYSKYPVQIPIYLVKQLLNRTRDIANKRIFEERARVRGELRREKETLEIFTRDDNLNNDQNDEDDFIDALTANRWNKNQFVHIDNIDNMPVLKGISNSFNILSNDSDDNLTNSGSNDTNTEGSTSSLNPTMTIKKSVWGTNVPVVLDPEEEALRQEEDRQFEEMLQKAKDSALDLNSSKGKKGKKGKRMKMIPLPL